jgi:hypothetical protein
MPRSESRRPRLIDSARRAGDTAQPRQQLVRTPHDSLRRQLARLLIEDRDRALVRVHVETDPPGYREPLSAPPRGFWASAEGPILRREQHPALRAGGVDARSISRKPALPYGLDGLGAEARAQPRCWWRALSGSPTGVKRMAHSAGRGSC